MGSLMACRLLDAGHALSVHNRTPDRAAALLAAGARWADRPCDVWAVSDVVISCLRGTDAVESVYLGDVGLLAHARPGQIFVEHGTFDPALARQVAAAADANGAAFVDLPVSGGPEGARSGTLTGMAGGTPDAVAAATAVVAAYCSGVTRVGSHGAGLELKLVNQLLVSVHMAAAGEAVELLASLGLDLTVARTVLTTGWANSAMLDRSLAMAGPGHLDDTGATIDGMREVQSVVDELLDRCGRPAPVFAASKLAFESASGFGAGAQDPAALGRVGR